MGSRRGLVIVAHLRVVGVNVRLESETILDFPLSVFLALHKNMRVALRDDFVISLALPLYSAFIKQKRLAK